MNIFLPYSDINTSVVSLDDKRVNKMSIETAQILSAVVRTVDPNTTLPVYRLTHKNHPCTVWTRNNTENYKYTLQYLIAITNEFEARFNKPHACSKLVPYFLEFYKDMCKTFYTNSIQQLEPFVNCTDFKELEVHEAYRKCLTTKWNNDKRKPKWTNRDIPEFYAR